MKLQYIEKGENKYSNIKEVLKSEFHISDNLIIRLKKEKKIFLNGNFTYINKEINPNDIIEIDLDFEETSENILPTKMNLNILFEDDNLLILNKPSNTPVHPSANHFTDSLSNGVQFYFNLNNIKKKIRPVNRLDKDTSGIVIFAKNEYIQEALIKQMQKNEFKKEYYAILEGNIDKTFQTISAPIARKTNSIIERTVSPEGYNAVTHLELLKNFEYINSYDHNKNILLSFVKFKLETGRTHQLRVHSKYIGHPILGDTLYGNSSKLISRQALHAYKIEFIHPISKKQIILEAPLPNDMKQILKSKI